MDELKSEEWKFEIILASFKTGSTIPESRCDELLSMVRNWAEENGWGVVASYNEHKGKGHS
ncbi:MAG: hypothetical protein C0623_06500 [Desulfuromonas sp.]|nr:MAG: hypothetical protein C0623_06500 [Desulfuromonas sp.]